MFLLTCDLDALNEEAHQLGFQIEIWHCRGRLRQFTENKYILDELQAP